MRHFQVGAESRVLRTIHQVPGGTEGAEASVPEDPLQVPSLTCQGAMGAQRPAAPQSLRAALTEKAT